ncbi:hypothetical protein A4X09_0g7446 [Tilletia walkeri]|uniref:Uncharacterized protein n=1 Tax=Tilletia walkeri TaxID=117179 RepID=A0A8X7N1W4_9BASI|nr:hypothetical protein A4X09_0g7446 [Tilletia walkeri]
MGSQAEGWSKSLSIFTHGHAVAVPDREVPTWTSRGRDPLPVALASSLAEGRLPPFQQPSSPRSRQGWRNARDRAARDQVDEEEGG